TGAVVLKNTSGAALPGLRSYALTSTSGALDPSGWRTVADAYDQSGDGSVDSDGSWNPTSSSATQLAEETVGGNGGALGVNQQVVLSNGLGAWIQNPDEDIAAVLNFDGGISRHVNVNFVGNGGKRFESGDLNFDGALTAADWSVYIAGAALDLTGMSAAQAYQAGDLNNDGANDLFDFSLFKSAFETANGVGSFAAMLAAVPEPTTTGLATLAACLLGAGRRRTTARRCASRTATRLGRRTMSRWLALLFAATALCTAAPSRAAILEEFLFGESNGTLLSGAQNNVNSGNQWNEDAGDMAGSSIQNGSFRIAKSNDNFGTNYLDIANVTTGKVWLVAEIAGWNLSSTVGGANFNAAEPEEIRLAFLDNDGSDQGGSTITGQAQFQRTAAGGFELVGRLTTSSIDFGPYPLALNRNTPFAVALEIDENAENYSVYYKDGSNDFALLGTAPHVAGRDGNSVRFVANNNFGGVGEFFDIDRLYLTDTDPTNVTNDRLTLLVNTATGELQIRNDSTTSFDIDGYQISSSSSDLNFGNWNSLSDRSPAVDPVGAGTGIGETWDEAGGASDAVLSEAFLLGSSVFATGRSESLGNAFRVGGDANSLEFQYRNADSGAVVIGNVELTDVGPSPDFNGDGAVDGADFLIWQRGRGLTGQTSNAQGDANGDGIVNGTDLAGWAGLFGSANAQAGAQTGFAAVPEPHALLLGYAAVAAVAIRRRR
ncbi:MAG: hypothetical protein KDA61_07805, partial [Planctomycetales bacterium]|nr:hypothetical protein [Planctomycetales bacterium]